MKNCPTCNQPFEEKDYRQKFCSRTCSAHFNNKTKPAVCAQCKAPFVRDRTTLTGRFRKKCEKCVGDNSQQRTDAIKAKTLGEYYSALVWAAKHPQHKWNHVRKFCRSWNKDRAVNGCQVCGYKLHIEYCHIRPVSDFSDTATLGEINAESNVLILCRNHHWEQENGYITPSDWTQKAR